MNTVEKMPRTVENDVLYDSKPYISSHKSEYTGLGIDTIMQKEPFVPLAEMDAKYEMRPISPYAKHVEKELIVRKLARIYNANPTLKTISSSSILGEIEDSEKYEKYLAFRDFHSGLIDLSRAHGQPLDNFLDSFESLSVESSQILLSEMELLVCDGALPLITDTQDGQIDNFDALCQRIGMFETTLIMAGHVDDEVEVERIYSRLHEALLKTTGKHQDPKIKQIVEQYGVMCACEIAKENTNTTKITTITKLLAPSLAPVIKNRAAVELLIAGSIARMKQIQPHADEARERLRSAITSVKGVDLSGLYEEYRMALERPNAHHQDLDSKDAAPQTLDTVDLLDWEVLPPSEVREIAQDIVDRTNRPGRPVAIDLDRLKILANIRDRWGADRTYYAKGTLGARRMVRDSGQEAADEYILLILQEVDNAGVLIAEHAIAESPIAGPHAMYIFRQDVSEGLSWREVMALGKADARDLGARAVKHTHHDSPDFIDAMSLKIELFMTCTPEEFKKATPRGTHGIRIPKK